MKSIFLACLISVLGATAIAQEAPTQKKAYVIPHVFEQKGRINDTPYTFDTTMFILNTDPKGEPVVAELFLYENNGEVMRDKRGGPVCDPCQYEVAKWQKKSILIEDLFRKGLPKRRVSGYGIMNIIKGNTNEVEVGGYIVNSHGQPGVETSAVTVQFNPREVSIDKPK